MGAHKESVNFNVPFAANCLINGLCCSSVAILNISAEEKGT